MAVEAALHPAAFPCESCDCVDGIAPDYRWQLDGHAKTNRCFRKASDTRTNFVLSLFPSYQRGLLYVDGGLSKQPAFYLNAMEFLMDYVNGNKNKS